jgi:hypothetical protein
VFVFARTATADLSSVLLRAYTCACSVGSTGRARSVCGYTVQL